MIGKRDKIRPGDLVMMRSEWNINNERIGSVISCSEKGECIVMWYNEQGVPSYSTHVASALKIVEDDDDERRLLKRKCIIG